MSGERIDVKHLREQAENALAAAEFMPFKRSPYVFGYAPETVLAFIAAIEAMREYLAACDAEVLQYCEPSYVSDQPLRDALAPFAFDTEPPATAGGDPKETE